MKVIDTHCDALLKLQMAKRGAPYGMEALDYHSSDKLDTNFSRLQQGHVMVQFFAIFIEPGVPSDEKWQHALEQIDLFYTEVLTQPKMKHIRRWEDFDLLKEDEIGAVLTLEGADAFGNDLTKLRHLYRLGVMSIGLTWNNANLCGDGAGEPRAGGLTLLGKEVVKMNNENRILTDVSHLPVKGFWDVMEHAKYPFASHSNARSLCDHVRNLYDDQIKAMFDNDGFIHVVFNPPFLVNDGETATITDCLNHIEHLCSLGGVKQIGFGSDFDGISKFVKDLENSSQYQNLVNELLKHYSESDVRGFCHENFLNNRPGVE
ncbi:MAG TPA: dipeptidase [Bacillota bacterium]|nr:dipeptidase [Bacillota bacterium]